MLPLLDISGPTPLVVLFAAPPSEARRHHTERMNQLLSMNNEELHRMAVGRLIEVIARHRLPPGTLVGGTHAQARLIETTTP